MNVPASFFVKRFFAGVGGKSLEQVEGMLHKGQFAPQARLPGEVRMSGEAVIFDCDGVLIDSEIVVCRIVAEELSRLGYTISTEQVIARFAGRPDREMRAEIEGEWGQSIPEEFGPRVDRRTIQAYATDLKIIPGVSDALDAINLPVCVASSSYPEKLRLGLSSVGLYGRFMPNVISATMVKRGKPEPDIFLFAAGWMKASPMSCVVVEDSVPGVRAGVRAGMTVLGFNGGSHCGAEHADLLLQAGATSTFSQMRELPNLLEAFKVT